MIGVNFVVNTCVFRWRTFANYYKKAALTNFVDGDLIESFSSLVPAKKSLVAETCHKTVEELTKLVDELSRIH